MEMTNASSSSTSGAFASFVFQWQSLVLAVDSGAPSSPVTDPCALSGPFCGLLTSRAALATADLVALWDAAKVSNREWPMACLVRGRLSGRGRGGTSAAAAATEGPIALALLCWAAALCGELPWFFASFQPEVRALIRGECAAQANATTSASVGADSGGSSGGTSYRGVAARVTLALFGWFDAVAYAVAGADRAAWMATEGDVLSFLQRVGVELAQPTVAAPPGVRQPPTAAPPPLTAAAAGDDNDNDGAPSTPLSRGHGHPAGLASAAPPAAGPPRSARPAPLPLPVPLLVTITTGSKALTPRMTPRAPATAATKQQQQKTTTATTPTTSSSKRAAPTTATGSKAKPKSKSTTPRRKSRPPTPAETPRQTPTATPRPPDPKVADSEERRKKPSATPAAPKKETTKAKTPRDAAAEPDRSRSAATTTTAPTPKNRKGKPKGTGAYGSNNEACVVS